MKICPWVASRVASSVFGGAEVMLSCYFLGTHSQVMLTVGCVLELSFPALPRSRAIREGCIGKRPAGPEGFVACEMCLLSVLPTLRNRLLTRSIPAGESSAGGIAPQQEMPSSEIRHGPSGWSRA